MSRPVGFGCGLPLKAIIGYPVTLLIAILLPIISTTDFFVLGMNEFFSRNETAPQWFQRAGSLTTVISVLIEYLIIKRLYLQMRGIPTEDTRMGTLSLEDISYLNGLQRGAVVILLTGTVIWGYGDVLLSAT